MQSYIMQNKELTNFFQKFFGSSLKNAYISVPIDESSSVEKVIKQSEHVSWLFKDIKDSMIFDPGCMVVLQFSDMKFVEIDPSSCGSPMNFSVFDSHNSVVIG